MVNQFPLRACPLHRKLREPVPALRRARHEPNWNLK
jgi:hypothetical protein